MIFCDDWCHFHFSFIILIISFHFLSSFFHIILFSFLLFIRFSWWYWYVDDIFTYYFLSLLMTFSCFSPLSIIYIDFSLLLFFIIIDIIIIIIIIISLIIIYTLLLLLFHYLSLLPLFSLLLLIAHYFHYYTPFSLLYYFHIIDIIIIIIIIIIDIIIIYFDIILYLLIFHYDIFNIIWLLSDVPSHCPSLPLPACRLFSSSFPRINGTVALQCNNQQSTINNNSQQYTHTQQ